MRVSLAATAALVTSFVSVGLCQSAKPTLSESAVKQFQWRSIGPANMSGRITSLAVYEADRNIWWAASASGGLLKTTNNGVTFEHQFDHEATVSIGDVQVSQSNPDIVWVGTGEGNPRNSSSWGDGVYKSTDGGKSWKNMGLKKIFQTGRIAIHPTDPNIVYVGALGRLWGESKERGLFKTTDGGKTWKKLLYVDERTGVIDVQMNRSSPDTLLVATYERQRDGFDGNDPKKKFGPGAGIYRTTDGGANFTRVSLGLPKVNLGRIGLSIYAKDPAHVYAVVESEKIGLAPDNFPFVGFSGSSADVGAKITAVTKDSSAAKAGLKVGDIVISVDEQQIINFADLQKAIRQKSAGDKAKWEVVRSGKKVGLKFTYGKRKEPTDDEKERESRARVNPRSPFSQSLGGQVPNLQGQQGESEDDFGGIYHSDDGGVTWNRINSLNPRPMYYSQIRVDPSDRKRIYVLGTSLYRSSDGGKTFSGDGAGGAVHVDHHALWIDPTDGRHIVLGNDGGIYVTYDRMENWDHHNHVAIAQFYHVGVSSDDNYNVYGGLQDNGSWGGPSRVRDASGPMNADWFRVGGGDGFICLVDPTDPNQIYYESQNGSMSRVNLKTGQRGFIRPRAPRGTSYRFNWKTPFILSPHNPQIHYSAGNYVFRSVSKGNSLKPISPEITLTDDAGAGSAITESPRVEGALYVGTTDGAVWVTNDGGKTWTDLRDADSLAKRNKKKKTEAKSTNPSEREREEKGNDSKAAQPQGAKAVAGNWKGVFTGDNLPSGQNEITFSLKVGAKGILAGQFESPRSEGEVVGGRFDPETNKLEFEVKTDRSELKFSSVVVTDSMSGTIDIGNGSLEAEFEASRTNGENAGKPSDGSKPLHDLVPEPRWVSSLTASAFEDGRCYLSLDGHRSNDDKPYLFVTENFGSTWKSIRANIPTSAGVVRVLREDIENANVLYAGCEFSLWVSIDRGENWTRLNSNLPTVAVHEIAQHPTRGEIVAGTHGRALWIMDATTLRQLSKDSLASKATFYQPNTVIRWRSMFTRGSSGTRQFTGSNPSRNAEFYYSIGSRVRQVELTVSTLLGEKLFSTSGETELGLHVVKWNLATQSRGQRSRTVPTGEYLVTLIVDGEEKKRVLSVVEDPDYPETGRPEESEELLEALLGSSDEEESRDSPNNEDQ